MDSEHKNAIEKAATASFTCDRCQAVFNTRDGLAVHMKKHEFLVTFFVPKASRRLQLNSNGEVVPVFYCPHCASEYILKYNLKRHIKEAHEDRIEQPPEEIVTCSTCNAIFFNRKAYNNHNKHSVNDLFMPESGLPNLKVDLD